MPINYPEWLLNANYVGWGLEPAMHGPEDRNMDYLLTTGHLKNLLIDFQNFKETGANIARTGLRTRYANPQKGEYDFKNAIEQAIVARICGIRLLWDMSHYDIPRHIKEPFTDELTDAFLSLTLEFIKSMKSVGVTEFGICVFNEIEFWNHCVNANDGWMRPYPITEDQKDKWGQRCLKTTLDIMKVVQETHPDIPFLIAEPAQKDVFKNFVKRAYEYDPKCASNLILGLNIYPHTEPPITQEQPVEYFTELINFLKQNYPNNYLMISETSYYGDQRVPWMLQIEKIMKQTGIIPVIWYPSLDHEKWENRDIVISHGGWNQDDKRTPYEPLINEVKRINGV